MGIFNARCGELMEDPEALPRRQVLDVVKNRQGEDLMDFLGNTGIGMGSELLFYLGSL